VFPIWQLLAWLIFRCKKQLKQLEAAEGDWFPKGQSGNATGPTRRFHDPGHIGCRAVALPYSVRLIHNRGNLACCIVHTVQSMALCHITLKGGDGRSLRQFRGTTRIDKSAKPAIVMAWALFVVTMLSTALLTGIAAGADSGSLTLAGNTLSAVTWVPRSAATPGGGALSRFMLQAYLRQDGSALIRIWDPARNAYTRPVERNWTLSGSTLCLDLPAPGPGRVCAEVHIWGPRIAGVGTTPYAMLDGDLKPGNTLFGTR
jgi:hypothetical protein